MYCPICGAKNRDGDMFCEKCGSRLEVANISQNECLNKGVVVNNNTSVNKKKQAFSVKKISSRVIGGLKKHKIPIIVILVLCVLAVGGFFTLSYLTEPDRVVEKYVDNLITENWDKVYETMSFEEDDFINKNSFSVYASDNFADYSKIQDYNVKEIKSNSFEVAVDSDTGKKVRSEANDDALIKEYNVEYVLKGSSSVQTFSVTLVKQKEKFLFLFPTYKISTDDMVQEFTIYVLPDSTIYFDDLELNESCEEFVGQTEQYEGYSDTKVSYDTYEIPAVFNGDHNIYAEHSYCDSYDTDIDTAYSDSVTISVFQMNKSTTDSLNSEAEKVIESIADAAIAEKKFDSIGIKCTSDSDSLTELKASYDDIASDLKNEDGEGLVSIDFKSFTYGTTAFASNDMTYRCSFSFTYDYKEKYKSSDTLKEDTGSDKGYATITFVCEDDQWVVKSIDSCNIYY